MTANYTLIAIPLFVFMGVMLEKSKIADDLMDVIGHLAGGLRGGMGIGIILVGVLMGATTGIVGATIVTLGPHHAAGADAARLPPADGLRHDLRIGHARTDHPAEHHPHQQYGLTSRCTERQRIVGFTAPPGKQMGHAGATTPGSSGTAQAKKEALEAKVRVGEAPTETAAIAVETLRSA